MVGVKPKRKAGRPRTTGGGSNRVEFRVTDAEMADLARSGNPNAEAKRRTFAAPATPGIKTVVVP